MTVRPLLPVLLCSALLVSGCVPASDRSPGPVDPGKGAIAFRMEMSSLQSSATITAATATLSRDGYDAITKELTVAGGVATGQVDGLDPGYWHIVVDVYENAALIYTGAADVNVVAGATAQCNILFDPVAPAPPTTGSIAITVGLNPMPGYSVLNQTVSEVLFDGANGKLYVLDGPAKIVGVYDADTLVRIEDLTLPGEPLSVALNTSGTGIYLGYSSGHIRLLDIASGSDTLVADVLMQVNRMAPLNEPFLMVTGPTGYYDSDVKVVNATTGQEVSARSIWYSLAELLYNPQAKTVYAHHQGVSPTDIHYIKVSDAGTISSDGDSIYHGDYGFGRPLRVINDGTRLATSSGTMFTSAELTTNDLRYSGSLGISYVDLSVDDALGKLYLLNSAGIKKLLVMDQVTFFVELTVDLPGTPLRVFNTPTSVIVFATQDARTFAKSFPKTTLGL